MNTGVILEFRLLYSHPNKGGPFWGGLPGEDVWQFVVDEVSHTLVFRGAVQEKLEGCLVSTVIVHQTFQCRCHGSKSGRKTDIYMIITTLNNLQKMLQNPN